MSTIKTPLPDVTTADTSSTSMDRMEWSRSTIINFIEDYRRERVLWDPNTKGYHIKQTKYEALKALGNKYGAEIRSIRSKIKSLRSSFHREHGKVVNGLRTGHPYQPMWFAYEAIHFILDGESQRTSSFHMNSEAEEAEDKVLTTEVGSNGDIRDENLCCLVVKEAREKNVNTTTPIIATTLKTITTPTTSTNTQTYATAAAMRTAATTTNAYNSYDNNIVARVATVAATVNATHTSNRCSDELAGVNVTRSEYDGEIQNYCNISAEDVKTEIIETDSQDINISEEQRTPSPINYCKPRDTSLTNNRKRKHFQNYDQNNVNETTLVPTKMQIQEYSNMHTRQRDLLHKNVASSSYKTSTQLDEYGVFGEYVAITIRKLKSSKAQIVVKHLINNLLYEAELGKYDDGISSSKEPPQLYRM